MKTLIINNKEYNRIKRIGKGLFSWAYLLDNGSVMILQKTGKSYNDITKLALNDINNWYGNIPHLPEVDHLDTIYYCGWHCEVYIMPRYQKLTKKHKTAYAQYQLLKAIYDQEIDKFKSNYGYTRLFGYADRVTYGVIDQLRDLNKTSLKDAITQLISNISNYQDQGYFNLDIKLDNFMVDDKENLILLDLFYDVRSIKEYF